MAEIGHMALDRPLPKKKMKALTTSRKNRSGDVMQVTGLVYLIVGGVCGDLELKDDRAK